MTNIDNTIRGSGSIDVDLINEAAGRVEIAVGDLLTIRDVTGGTINGETGAVFGGNGVFRDLTFTGSLAATTTATPTLQGAIDNRGTLTFAGTPLNVTNESLLISGDVLLSGGGEIVLVEANDSVIANAGATPGTLTNVDNTIRGAGQIQSLTLNNQGTIRAEGGEVTFTGVDFTQTAGRLEVAEDGVLRASQELLILDGQVGGTGIIIGDIRNQGGTINAGDLSGTTGTLALEGDLFHETDSTLFFDIGLPDSSQFDLLDIDGGLELLGGGLEVSLISGDFLIPESTRIDIVLASDGISGTLDSVLLPTDSLGNALFSVDVDSAGIISLVALQDIQGVAIPEPSSAGICLIAGILLTIRRRRIA